MDRIAEKAGVAAGWILVLGVVVHLAPEAGRGGGGAPPARAAGGGGGGARPRVAAARPYSGRARGRRGGALGGGWHRSGEGTECPQVCPQPVHRVPALPGAGAGIRTPDQRFTKPMLCH